MKSRQPSTIKHNKYKRSMVAACSIILASCASDVLTIPPVDLPKIEAPSPPNISFESGSTLEREHKALLASFGGEYIATRISLVLNNIAERLRLVSDRPSEYYRVTILNSPSVNAFALPNGSIYLTRGLIALANDTAEIASVLAHEIAHVTNRHAMERNELENRNSLLSRVHAEILKNPETGQQLREKSRLSFANFSRQQEIDADEVSVRALAKAGFEVHGAMRFLVSLERSSQLRAALRGVEAPTPDILSTHPTTPERIEKALLVARQYAAPGLGEAERTTWLQAINGMIYGDDPAQGLVRGRVFFHPRLKFTFKAPEGFTLENTANAVLGVSPTGREAMRFDQVSPLIHLSLAQILITNPVEGIALSDIREISLAGLPAATGLARGPEWTFRVVLLQADGITYRFIYAMQHYDEALDTAFLASAQSFKPLTSGDGKSIRPTRIALIPAKAGERAQDIAASRMADIPQAYNHFLVLNGLDDGEAPIPGRSYKVIVD